MGAVRRRRGRHRRRLARHAVSRASAGTHPRHAAPYRQCGRSGLELARHIPRVGLGRAGRDRDLDERRGGRRRALGDAQHLRWPNSTRSGSRTSARRRSSGRGFDADGRLANAIVWQDRRTAERCRESAELIRERTLVADPASRRRSSNGCLRASTQSRDGLAFGPSMRSSSGISRATACTQPTGRTRRARSSTTSRARVGRRVLACGVDRVAAARVARPRLVGEAGSRRTRSDRGIVGDQQAALFGQGCFAPRRREGDVRDGRVRARELGVERRSRAAGTAPTVSAARPKRRDAVRARRLGADERRRGAMAPRRARHRLAAWTSRAARGRSRSTAASTFVPALAGLGAPHWDSDARGLVAGSRAARRAGTSRARARGSRPGNEVLGRSTAR